MADPTKRRWKELAVAGHLVGELRADTVQHMTQMQKRTFTNWVNLHLRDRIMMVRDLFADFEDGVLLINLIEIISGSRSVGKYNKKPKIINQKLENVQMALDFLNKEGIKLVNIGNSDIVEGNSKLILGLIWTLILRYHITKGSGEQGNAKSELLRWVRSKIPRYNIQNFTTDWNSGNALCALVNALKRGTCPDHQTLDGSSLDKAQKGISLAESELNIPPLISAEDMTDPKVDDLSMMTYISFFRNLDPDISEAPVAEGPGLVEAEIRGAATFVIKKNKTKGDYVVLVQGPNGPVEVKTNTPDNADYINVTYIPMDLGDHEINVTLDGEHINDSPFHPRISLGISAVNAHGDGLERGNPGEQAKFVVEPNGYDGDLIVLIKDPSGQDLSSQIDKNEAGIYECSYLPSDIGEYTISITMNGKVVPNSPFVAKIGLDVSAVSAHGPGLEQPATGRNAEFVVEPNGIKGDLKIVAVNPQGEEIPCESNLGEDGNYACHYLPNRPGDYVITISMNGLNIPNSPFTAKVETDVGEVRAFGPGLEGGQADDSASFIVDPKGTGENAELQVIVKGPNGEDYPATMSKQDDGTWACSYEPTIPGDYEVSILLDGKHVPGSPFTVHIDPNVSKINAHGPGLESGETGQPAPFKVEPNGQDGDLKVTIKGPNGEEISANINKDESGNYDCSYLPNAAGVYEVSITMSGKELPQSPFKVDIAPDASKIKAHGPGLESATSGQPAEFVVEMNGVSGEPQVSITNGNGEEVPVQITQDENGNFLCHYEPAASGLLTVSINANGKPAAQSPYQVPVEPDISKIVASGPGLEGGEVGFPAIFGVEINGQDGDLEAMVQQPDGEILPITLTKNSDGDYDCEYLPTNPGDHTIFINMNGKDIPNSPFKVTIEPEGGDKQGKVVDKETGKRRIRDGFKNGRSAFLMGNGVAMSFAPDSETAKRLTWENFVQNMKRIVEEKLELSDVQWETDLSKLTDQIDQKLSEMAEDSEVNREFLEFEVVSDTYNVIRTMPIDLKAGMANTLRKFQQKGLPKIPILTVNSDDFLEIVMGRFPMLAKDISPKKLEEAEVAKKFIVHLHGVFTRRDDFALTSREYNESAPQFLKFFQEYNSKIRRSLVMLGCHKTLFDPHFVSFFDWYNSLFEEPAQKAEQISSTAPYSHTDNALLQLLQAINGGQFSKVGELEQHLKEGLLVELGPGGSQEEANLHKVITALKDKLGEFTRKAAWAREVTNVMKSLPKKLRDAVKETIQDGITQHYWIVTDKEANSCQKLIEQRGWTRIIAVVEYGPQYSDLPSFLGEIAEQLGKQ